VQLLVEGGANIESRNNEERTALIVAALKGKKEVVEFLLGKAANTESGDNWIYSADIGRRKRLCRC
jgi:ankyrin repeat protein